MFLIRPQTIDDAALLASNVSESAPAAWSSGTTYAAGDTIAVTTGTSVQIYKSLAGGNLNHSPASSPAWWVTDGATYTAWSGATTYAAGDRVIDAAGHRVYESLAASNLNHALTDPAWWLDVAPTNRWAMFDSKTGTATAHPYRIDVTLQLSGRVDALALLGLVNATSAHVVVTAAGATVYEETFDLNSTDGVDDWYAYYFNEVEKRATLCITELPVYLDPQIEVTIEGTGTADVELGLLSAGFTKDLGETQHDGAQIGITDYSRKDIDAFGNYTIIERAFSKRGSFKTRIAKSAVDSVHAVLAQYRATPAVYSASSDYGATLIFGFFRDFQIEIDYPLESLVSIEIEGLT